MSTDVGGSNSIEVLEKSREFVDRWRGGMDLSRKRIDEAAAQLVPYRFGDHSIPTYRLN